MTLTASVHGEPRATNDIDLVVDLPAHKVHSFAEALGPDFDVDEEALTEAMRSRRSWNIYFLPWVLKVDLFAKGTTAFDQSEFARRRPLELAPGKSLFIKSPEDSVLRKLLWYREGGEVSNQQWRDVVEILRVGAAMLDFAYLQQWAASLGLSALLEEALGEAKRPLGER